MEKTKQIIGYITILLIIISGVTYIYFKDKVAIRIDEDKTVFYTNISGRYLISAQQNDRIFSGTSIVDRVTKSIQLTNRTEGNKYIKERNTEYENGERIVHSWTFNPYSAAIEDFPLLEKICVYNATGKFYRYSLDKLVDAGPKRKLIEETSAEFGRNIKITFEPNYRWAWIGYPYGSDSFAVQYDIDSDEECFDIRLFDPTPMSLYISGYERNINVEIESAINITTNATPNNITCIDILNHPEGGINLSCKENSTYYDFTLTYFNQSGFNDSTTSKNLSVNADYNNGTACAQEWANISTSCGGLDSGTYEVTGSWDASYPAVQAYDGIYTILGLAYSNTDGSVYVNYTKPYFATNESLWRIAHYSNNGGGDVIHDNNYAIPDGCWNNGKDNLVFRMRSYNSRGIVTFSCYDSTDSEIIVFTDTDLVVAIAEEAMSWKFTNTSNDTFYIKGHEFDDVYNLSFYLEGRQLQGNYPTGVNIYVNEVETNSIALITEVDTGQTTTFADGESESSTTFNTFNITINDADYGAFSGSTITSNMTFNITGKEVNKTCYQESATIEDQAGTDTENCGLFYNGSYVFTGTWLRQSAANDGSFSGWTSGSAGGTVYMYINYTKPTLAKSAEWTARYVSGTSSPTLTSTLPSTCFANDPIQLRISLTQYTPQVYSCYTGSAWSTVWSVSGYTFFEEAIEWTVNTGYPANLWINVGDIVANKSWNYTAELSTTQTVTVNSTVIEDYMDSCEFSGGVCNVPIWVFSEQDGGVLIDDLKVNYSNPINPVTISGSYIEDYLRTQTGSVNIPIRFEASSNGDIEVSNVSYKYKGGNQTIKIRAHTPSYDTNVTYNVTYFYSKYNKSPPYSWTNVVFFQPKTNNSKNITAYYQTASRAILNFTSYTRGHEFNISAYINETDSCLNLTLSTNSTKSAGNVISNTSEQNMFNQNSTENKYLWAWADLYDCDSSVKKYLQPKFIFESCCTNCEVCP